jgi:hypothetical protein
LQWVFFALTFLGIVCAPGFHKDNEILKKPGLGYEEIEGEHCYGEIKNKK